MMISDDTPDEHHTRQSSIKTGVRKVVLGGLTLYALCALGPGVIEYLTVQITPPMLVMLIVAVGLPLVDVGSLMLILDGLTHLRKALTMKAVPVVVVTNQPSAHAKEHQ